MQAKFKWLFLPPALALVLFLGPLQSESSTRPPTDRNATKMPATPELPGGWRITSTLIGVLLLGAVGIVVYQRLSKIRPTGDAEFMRLRQTLRLSQRHNVYAVEFDGEVLLLGETDGNIGVIRSGGAAPEVARDEAEVLDRGYLDDGDDGAVPRDMVIPRPSAAVRARPGTQAAATLANFKNLLTRTRSTAGASR